MRRRRPGREPPRSAQQLGEPVSALRRQPISELVVFGAEEVVIERRDGDLLHAPALSFGPGPQRCGLVGGRALDVANVIWCTGFGKDVSWIDIPVTGEDG